MCCGALIQGMRIASRVRKRQGTDSLLESPEGTTTADTFQTLTSRTVKQQICVV